MYDERAEDKLIELLNNRPHTANSVTTELRSKEYRHIDRKSVKRMLEKMKSQKRIDSFKIGEVILWSNKKLARNIKHHS